MERKEQFRFNKENEFIMVYPNFYGLFKDIPTIYFLGILVYEHNYNFYTDSKYLNNGKFKFRKLETEYGFDNRKLNKIRETLKQYNIIEYEKFGQQKRFYYKFNEDAANLLNMLYFDYNQCRSYLKKNFNLKGYELDDFGNEDQLNKPVNFSIHTDISLEELRNACVELGNNETKLIRKYKLYEPISYEVNNIKSLKEDLQTKLGKRINIPDNPTQSELEFWLKLYDEKIEIPF